MDNISPLIKTTKNSQSNSKADIAIIGDGFAGAMTVFYLLRHGIAPDQLLVFGKNPLGQGQAYGGDNPDFRLNVRADLMRVFPEDVVDFATWADDHCDDEAAKTTAGNFFRRYDFARYVKEQLDAMAEGWPIPQIKKSVIDISRDNDEASWQIKSEDAEIYSASMIVLATGNLPPSPKIAGIADLKTSNIIDAPWRGNWVKTIKPDDHIAVIGGGLTAMDAITNLGTSLGQSFKGRLSVVTPYGQLPAAQLGWQIKDGMDWPKIKTASGFLRFMRQYIGKSDWFDPDEQAEFERLRIGFNAAWHDLPMDARNRLIKKLGWRWQLLRYRAAPQAWQAWQKPSEHGRFSLIKSRAISIANEDMKLGMKLGITLDNGKVLKADKVILATGAGHDPLLKTMMDNGLIQGHDGQVMVDQNLKLSGNNGKPISTAFALGSSTVVSMGDIIGATTIAQQAETIADQIAISPPIKDKP